MKYYKLDYTVDQSRSLNVEGQVETVAGLGTSEYPDNFLEHKGTKHSIMGSVTCKANGCCVCGIQRTSTFSVKTHQNLPIPPQEGTK